MRLGEDLFCYDQLLLALLSSSLISVIVSERLASLRWKNPKEKLFGSRLVYFFLLWLKVKVVDGNDLGCVAPQHRC